MSKRKKRRSCIYCQKAADSQEHIIATRFIDVLREDPRGMRLPLGLHATLSTGKTRTIGGKQLKAKGGGKRYTLEYTTRVCSTCNSGWMNNVDTAAFSYVAEMIRGNAVTLDPAAQGAVAAWICKLVVTARNAPHDPLPIDREWTDHLHAHHSAPPRWLVWIGRYVGDRPWWFNPRDIRLELGEGSEPAPPGFIQDNGVLATLVIGHLVLQVFGISGDGPQLIGPHAFGEFPRIWPAQPTAVAWPPPYRIDDQTLEAFADRFENVPAYP